MSRRLRFIPAESLVEVTSRTIQGRLLLQPSPQIADLCRGVLARAARLYPVEIHAFAFLGNHYHLLMTVPDARRLAEFMNFLNSNLAREVGRAVGWRERFWGRRYQAIAVSAEPAAQVGRLRYILSQGCKEGLVRRPEDWPGATSTRSLLTGETVSGTWIDRTGEYKAARRGRVYDPRSFVATERFDLAPLPCWRNASGENHSRWAAELVRTIALESERAFADGERRPLDANGLAHQNPHQASNWLKRTPAPLVHAASKSVRAEFRKRYRRFADSFRRASEELRSTLIGLERFCLFPAGAFPPAGPFLSIS